MSKSPPLTIVIPTRNRSQFLIRALSYYRQMQLDFPMIIADSSTTVELAANQATIDTFRSDLKLEYQSYSSDINAYQKIITSLNSVSTPYVVMGADDDFFVPSALGEAVRFLQDNSDYSVAHGEALVFILESGTSHGRISQASQYNQRTISKINATDRLFDHLANYTPTWYSVHRTEQLSCNMRKAAALPLDFKFGELLPSCLSIIQGKAKQIDGLYMVRQAGTAKEYPVSTLRNWATSAGWIGRYECFLDRLAEALVAEDKLDIRRARSCVNHAFRMYLAPYLGLIIASKLTKTKLTKTQRAQGYTDLTIQRLRLSLRKLPGIRYLAHSMRHILRSSGSEESVSLSKLFDKASPYYEEFQPIYRAVSEDNG